MDDPPWFFVDMMHEDETRELREQEREQELLSTSVTFGEKEEPVVKVPIEASFAPGDAYRLAGVTAEHGRDSSTYLTVRGEVTALQSGSTKKRDLTIQITVYNTSQEVIGALDEEFSTPPANSAESFECHVRCSRSHGSPGRAKVRIKDCPQIK